MTETKKTHPKFRDSTDGFFWIPRAIDSSRLSWKARLAYWALAAKVKGDSSVCHESVRNLSSAVGVGQTTLRQGLKELEKNKVIQVNRRSWNNPTTGLKEQLPSEYLLLSIKPQKAAYAPPAK